jgi:23S rRNA pseudouridine2604 synthase
LLVLSQDGVLAREVIAGVFVSKTYLVEVDKMVTQNDLDRLNGPCKFLTDVIRPIRVRLLAPTLLEFVLREGKNRQIRRMCEQMGLIVVDLFRVRLGKSELGSLPEGSWRTMPTVEGNAFKNP